jgi:hypothetical protein
MDVKHTADELELLRNELAALRQKVTRLEASQSQTVNKDKPKTSRRALLKRLAVVTAGTAAVVALTQPESAAANLAFSGTFSGGAANIGATAVPGSATPLAPATGDYGVIGASEASAPAPSGSAGVYGGSTAGTGVAGKSGSGTGVTGESTSSTGVSGTGATGVSGTSNAGTGVNGTSTSGIGVSGTGSTGLSGSGNTGVKGDGTGAEGIGGSFQGTKAPLYLVAGGGVGSPPTAGRTIGEIYVEPTAGSPARGVIWFFNGTEWVKLNTTISANAPGGGNTILNDLILTAGPGIQLSPSGGNTIQITNTAGGAGAIPAINGLFGNLSIVAGTGISVLSSGTTITISSTVTGGGGTPTPSSLITFLPAAVRVASTIGGDPIITRRLTSTGATPKNPLDNSSLAIQVTGVGGIPSGIKGVFGVLTCVGVTNGGNLRLWTGTTVPNAVNLNIPGSLGAIPNLSASFSAPVDATGKVNLGYGTGVIGASAGYALDISAYIA